MHASCSICGDIFTGVDPEVLHSTPCGHIFHYPCLLEWLRRVPNCPHCRAKVDERKTIKLYFQLNSYPVEDNATLCHQVQNLQFQLKMKEHDLNKAQEEANEAKTQTKGLRSRLLKREDEIRTHETVVANFQEQIKVLKSQLKGLSEAQLQAEELQKKLKQYENLQMILKGSAADAAEALAVMKDVSDPSILCTCISTLKKELSNFKAKYKEMHQILSSKETKLASAMAEIATFQKRMSILNRSLSKLKEDLSHTENENEALKKKCKHLEEAIISPGSSSSSSNPRDKALKRLINEYPVPNIKRNSTSSIDIDVSSVSDSNTKVTETGISPISPIRLHNDVRHRPLLNSRRIPPAFKSVSTSKAQCYDGLGGHVTDDIPRTERSVLLALTKNKTNKLLPATKKLKSGSSSGKQQSDLLSFVRKM